MEIKLNGATELQRELGAMPRAITAAMVRAMNRALTSGRTAMVRAIAQDTGLKSGDLRKAVRIAPATWSRPEARMATSLKRLPLILFGAKGPMPSRGRGKGVSWRLAGGARNRVPNAFLAQVRSPQQTEMGSAGHLGVFVRRGKGRLPIRQLYGPSLGHVFGRHRPTIAEQMRQTFSARVLHELDRVLKGQGSTSTGEGGE
jgi:hypothetical protein